MFAELILGASLVALLLSVVHHLSQLSGCAATSATASTAEGEPLLSDALMRKAIAAAHWRLLAEKARFFCYLKMSTHHQRRHLRGVLQRAASDGALSWHSHRAFAKTF
jgi:hypothetical protein